MWVKYAGNRLRSTQLAALGRARPGFGRVDTERRANAVIMYLEQQSVPIVDRLDSDFPTEPELGVERVVGEGQSVENERSVPPVREAEDPPERAPHSPAPGLRKRRAICARAPAKRACNAQQRAEEKSPLDKMDILQIVAENSPKLLISSLMCCY